MSALPQAQPKHQASVEHWVNGNKPLVRSECGWIMETRHAEDCIAIKSEERDRGGLESLFDILVRTFPRVARLVRERGSHMLQWG
jgi:hypothetical protein